MTSLRIRPVEYASGAYQQTLLLRQEILRKPLGLQLSPEDLFAEKNDHHIAVFEESGLVACLVLTPLPDNTVKMKQVAVAEEKQGRGIGKKMVKWAEDFSRKNGYNSIVMNARKTATGFYSRLGYETLGGPFTEVTVPHYKMKKDLQKT